MAKPKPEKKPAAAAPATSRILPMELQIGDRLADETGGWEVVGRPRIRRQVARTRAFASSESASPLCCATGGARDANGLRDLAEFALIHIATRRVRLIRKTPVERLETAPSGTAVPWRNPDNGAFGYFQVTADVTPWTKATDGRSDAITV